MTNTEFYEIHEEILNIEKLIEQQNQIVMALAYLEADQPHLAKLVLEGMEP